MARIRSGSRRDAFTPSGHGKPLGDQFSAQDVPDFKAKHQRPSYLNQRIRRAQKGQDGEA
jgi:hypothetical protein